MLKQLPPPVKGVVAALLFALNTLFWCLTLYLFIPLKLISPTAGMSRWCTEQMVRIAERWIDFNRREAELLHHIDWHIETVGTTLDGLHHNRSYLVCANHQSWVDIVMLQTIFNRRIPFLRFFLKRQLMWVPLLGLAWWALDFPFMKRHSKDYLARHPEKRGQDLETTRKMCQKFRGRSISVINFLEGTRLTPAKHARSKSSYRHLLPPKTGGVAFVIDSLGDQFDSLLDVTLHYPEGAISLWGLFTGKLQAINVRIERIEIPRELIGGNYMGNDQDRDRMQEWVRQLWSRKDGHLDTFEANLKTSNRNGASRPQHLHDHR